MDRAARGFDEQWLDAGNGNRQSTALRDDFPLLAASQAADTISAPGRSVRKNGRGGQTCPVARRSRRSLDFIPDIMNESAFKIMCLNSRILFSPRASAQKHSHFEEIGIDLDRARVEDHFCKHRNEE